MADTKEQQVVDEKGQTRTIRVRVVGGIGSEAVEARKRAKLAALPGGGTTENGK